MTLTNGRQCTVVHVVGESDTGNDDLRRDRLTERRARLTDWLATVRSGDAVELLQTGRLAGQPDPRFSETPLRAVLAALDPTPAAVTLVLLGTEGTEDIATAPIAAAIADAVVTDPHAFGPRVVDVRLLVAHSFDEDEIVGLVRNALWPDLRPPGEVLLTWGSGSTGLMLAAASGVLESGAELRLRSSNSPAEDVVLVPEPDIAPLVPWLLRLGYPEQIGMLAQRNSLRPSPSDAVLAYATAQARQLERLGRGQGDVDDLAAWVRADLRRLDGTAGMAVRAWLEAEYHRRCTADGVEDLLGWARLADRRLTLGKVLQHIKAHRTSAPAAVRESMDSDSGRWLRSTDVSMLNGMGIAGSHAAAPVTSSAFAVLRGHLPPDPLPPPDGMPALLLPTGRVAVIWTTGTSNHRPYGDTLLSRGLGANLVRHCGPGPSGRLDLTCLILGTEGEAGSLAFARTQAAALVDGGEFHGQVSATAIAITERSEKHAEDATAAALHADATDVDAVVVVPVGPKEVVLGALLAGLRHGQARAIPVLLASVDRNATAAHYHRIVPYLGADRTLARLARRALHRLELRTAARLCGIGSPRLQRIVADLDELEAWLWRPRPEGVRGRLRLCAARLQPRPGTVVSEPDRVRLVHCAGELAFQHGPRMQSDWVEWLIRTRHNLMVGHGGPAGGMSVKAAVGASVPPRLVRVFTDRRRAVPSAPDLVGRAAQACPADEHDGHGAQLFEAIDQALADAALDNPPSR